MIGRTHLVQWCPRCRALVEARLELKWSPGGQLVEDRSECPCGAVLWDWDWDRPYQTGAPPRRAEQMALF